MMRKLYIFGLIALAATIVGLAWAEQLTLTTYYPAPYGVYKDMVVTNSLNVGDTDGYGNSRLSIYGSEGNNDATFTTAKQDGTINPVFSILPWDSQVYLSAGIYYSQGGWRHYSDNQFNELFVLDPGAGARWYASSTSSPTWNLATNVQLWNNAGAWIGPSSRDLKENFTPLDFNDILQRISQLEITRWNFKGDEDSITHIGSVAEDFYQVFGTGDSNKTLATIDTAGVALAGVKGLANKFSILLAEVKAQAGEIKALKQQISSLKKAR